MATSIRISLGKRQLTLLQDGKTVRTYPVGVGKIATKTPTGTFKIINKVQDPERRPGGPRSVYGDFWMGLSKKGYGIHGTNNESSIGKFVSHGCIRMHNRDVLDLAKRVAIGTVVQIVP
ncbi:L,D-transpeptidase [Tumebacillus permanentifrigoris]|uniref:L,D-transpeptidase-like protein n=1 Tax=Tumebacillus permanentifrigoris TaxID=378543 RepID=A0A316D7P7_9BACL|nr:L,D-transpeptidase [Tumebacillus permanentifrigoris]PWK12753.1 L,D-transpeptidase-like protein [Tumebacillus permanentifrigoris]